MNKIGVVITWLVSICFLSQAFGRDSAEGIEYLGKVTVYPFPDQLVLGISSVRYRKDTNSLILVSDDTGAVRNRYNLESKARYYEIKLDQMWSAEDGTIRSDVAKKLLKVEEQIIIRDDHIALINNGHVDLESVALFDKKDLLFASEQGATSIIDSFFPFIHPSFEWNSSPSLIRVNSSGKLVARYTFPDYYTDDTDFLTFFRDYPHHDQRDTVKGVRRNKGIESIDRIPGTNSYVTITESPLLQDNRWWNKEDGAAPSRLAVFAIDDDLANKARGELTLTGEYFYQQLPLPAEFLEKVDRVNKFPRRGVVDVEVINEQTAFVVERNYIKYIDGKKPRSLTEVYRVKLGSSYNFAGSAKYPEQIKHEANKVLDKTLVLRTSDFEEKQQGGSSLFRKLNIEGITFGPDLPDGSKLMIMVNDNDASNASGLLTFLMFFKVPAHLVQ